MKSEKIFEALRNTDQELLERSEKRVRGRRRGVWVSMGAAAACLCLLCVSMLWTGVWSVPETRDAADIAENAAEIEEEAGRPELEQPAAGQQEAGQPAEGAENSLDGVWDQQPAGDGQQPPAGNGQQAKEEMAGNGRPQQEKQQAFKEEGLPNAEISDCVTGIISETSYVSMEELRAEQEYGQYLPLTVPAGYALESAVKSVYQDKTTLAVVWSRGMDSIEWRVDRAPRQTAVPVDVTKPEAYDVNLYTIPYADSVPVEYQETFSNPVFRIEDLSLEVVRARTKIMADSGDTSTPRANFDVLYGDGTLISFSGRGTAEELYGMFGE